MMKQKKLVIILSAVFALVLLFGIGAYAASNYGTQGDPLVTLSYLNDVLSPNLLNQANTQIANSKAELERAIENAGGNSDSFAIVTLSYGQSITGSLGTELMLRSGAVHVSGAAAADMTSGESLDSGVDLVVNHLTMMTADGAGVSCSTDSATLLVRGSYTVS